MNPFSHPQDLADERDAIIFEIYAAWKGVTREGGVSWSESVVIDDYGTQAQRDAARQTDVEWDWESLVDDESWLVRGGFGGFSFLDAIGFRYYLAPELIRCLRTSWSEVFPFQLTLSQGDLADYQLQQWALIDTRQSACIARAIRHLARSTWSSSDHDSSDDWWAAYHSHWNKFDAQR